MLALLTKPFVLNTFPCAKSLLISLTGCWCFIDAYCIFKVSQSFLRQFLLFRVFSPEKTESLVWIFLSSVKLFFFRQLFPLLSSFLFFRAKFLGFFLFFDLFFGTFFIFCFLLLFQFFFSQLNIKSATFLCSIFPPANWLSKS